MSRWVDDGLYHWFEWSDSDTDYEYAVRVACNNYEDISGESKSATFNILTDSPNANPPSGYTKFISLTGPISSTTYGTHAYNLGGPTTTYSYQVKQVTWPSTPRDYSYLVMYSDGGPNMNFKSITDGATAEMSDVVIGTSANASGVGESGVATARSHAFIGTGYSGSTRINYMGYVTGTDDGTTGAKGPAIVTKMTGLYGGSCAILDGGGSTQMYYNGSIVRSSTDGSARKLQTAIQLYRKIKTTSYTITTVASPLAGGTVSGGGTYSSSSTVTLTATANQGYTFSSWDDGYKISPRAITVEENKTYTALFTKNPAEDNNDSGTIHGKIKVYGKIIKSLLIDPIKMNNLYIKQNGQLKNIVKKYKVNYHTNGGDQVSTGGYFYGRGLTLPTPTHSDYESLPVNFVNWFSDSALTTPITKLGLLASGDRDYYAKWYQTKTQYSGYYSTGSGSDTVELSDSGYTGTIPTYLYVCDANTTKYDTDVTITHLKCNIDECDSSYGNYIKPELWYGYYTTPGTASSFVAVAKGMSAIVPSTGAGLDIDVNFVLPAGSSIGFRASKYTGDTVERTKLYYYGGSYTYSGAVTKRVDWQDSPDPPSGTWDSGYPVTRQVTRTYNGSSWSDWSVV